MSRQYIFKLTPNKKNVFINTSVLAEGKYADVEYPIQSKDNNDLGYKLDKDTYKFVDTTIFDDLKSKIYPVSMDISVNIPDIPFYAVNEQLSNYNIIFENHTKTEGNILHITNKEIYEVIPIDCVYPEYNIDITVNWSDKSNKDISNNISYTITVNKFETIPSDKQEFSDLSTYFDLIRQKEEDIKDCIINDVYCPSCGFIADYDVDNKDIEYDYPHDDPDEKEICRFRDSIYEGRRAVATLRIDATYYDPSTGRTVHASEKTTIYQAPYLGPRVSYDLISFVDYTQPMELFSPTVTYDYVHDDNANDKVDASTENIKSIIHIKSNIIADDSLYASNVSTVDTYCNYNINGFNIYAHDPSIDNFFDKRKNQFTYTGLYIDNYYFVTDPSMDDVSTYTNTSNDENNFINVLNYCISLSNSKANTTSSIVSDSLHVEDINKLSGTIDNVNINCKECDISIYAVYPKYYIDNTSYYPVIIKTDSVYIYEKECEYYFRDLYNGEPSTHHEKVNDTSWKIVNNYIKTINYKDCSNNIVTYYIDTLINHEWKDKSYNIHSMSCINDPINTMIHTLQDDSTYEYQPLVIYKEEQYTNGKGDTSYNNVSILTIPTQVPVYAAYPILTGYIPKYGYEYKFSDSSIDVVVINSSLSYIDEVTKKEMYSVYINECNCSRDKYNNLVLTINTAFESFEKNTNALYYTEISSSNNSDEENVQHSAPTQQIIPKPIVRPPKRTLFYGTDTTTSNNVTLSINIPNDHIIRNYLRINGKKCTENSLDVSPYIFSITLDDYTEELNNDTFDITVKDKNEIIKGKLLITNDEGEKSLHNFKSEGKDINNNMESFMLLRANPKLSGNVKLVVDSEYNLYLDTFKSSDKLNDSKYRKYPISAEGNYPRDIRTVFKSLPISELYKTPANSLNAHKIYRTHDMQFETMYEYGAETNKDILYSENMRILAPLHIGKHIPEFFTIFRYDGVYNEETYNGSGYQDIDKFINIIKESSVISTIDLRQYTSIGQYLNNYKDMVQNYGYGQCGLQFIEQDNIEGSESYRQGKNIWKGILVKNGILTEQTETSYFANKILSDPNLKNKQELFNNYIQSGFERHGLLYPNIINLEFMFNDNDNEEYTMHRYFGLYLYENDFINYKYITDNIIGHNNVLQKYDENGKLYNGDLKIFKDIFNNNYTDRIFYAVTDDKATRVKSETDVNEFLSNYIKDKPEYNVVNVNADPIEFSDNQKSFVTVFVNKPIKAGEHIKFVLMNVLNENIINGLESPDKTNAYHLYKHIVYELIASDDIRLRDTENNINPYVTTNVCEYNDIVTFNRVTFYTQNTLYPEITASVEDQIKRIIAAIELFEQDYLSVSYHDDKSISIISTHNETYLQHIAAPDITSLKYDYLHVTSIKDNRIHVCTTNENCSESLSYITDQIEHNIQIDKLIDDECYNYLNILENNDASIIETSSTYNYFSYVEAEEQDNIITDNFSYFNNSVTYNMKALSNITEYFDIYYVPFANYEFETIGWRHNNIVQFMNVKDLPHTYVLYSDIEDKIKDIVSPIVFTNTGLYESIHKFDIVSGYYTNNVINPVLYGSYIINTQQFKEDLSIEDIVTITNPFNSSYKMICSDSDVLLTNNVIRIYKPKSAQIAVMGISNIKDLDTNVEVKFVIHRENKQTFVLKANETVLCDESDIRIQHGVMYQVEEGTLDIKGSNDGLKSGTKFIILNDSKTYTFEGGDTATYNGPVIYYTDKSLAVSELCPKTDTIISIIDKQKYQNYNYSTDIPTIKLEHFFSDVDNTLTSDLMYPIVPLVNCAWESTGLYLDDNNIINVNNLSKDYEHTGHFTENVFTPSEYESNQYVINKIDNLLYVDGKRTTYRECILNKQLSHAIKKLLINDVNINTAVCHYNHNTYSLEFVYFGIKFVLSFNDKIINTHLHLDAYNNYHVFIINDYDISKRNEMFISMHDEFILLINHQFYIDYAHEADNNVKDITKDAYTGYAPYSTISEISTVDFTTLYEHNDSLYGHIKDNKGSYNKVIDIHNLWSSWFIQEGNENYMYSPLEHIMTRDNQIQFINYNVENIDKYYHLIDNKSDDTVRLSYVMTKADGDYNHQITKLISSINTKYDEPAEPQFLSINPELLSTDNINILLNKSYVNTAKSILSIDKKKYKKVSISNKIKALPFSNLIDIVGKPVFNILDRITDNENTKMLVDRSAKELQSYVEKLLYVESSKEKLQRYINSVNDNIDIYVIPVNEEVHYIQNTSDYNPIMFNLSIPNYIKYNYGWFKPHTNNMVEYNIDDLALGKIIDVDLLCANTSVKYINKLINYTGNKVFNKDKSNIKYNYFLQDTHSLLSSTWDNAFYRLYTSDNSYNAYDGQLTGIDDKSFFGSRCMVIRNPYILIDTYNYQTSNDLYKTSIVDSEFNTGSGNTKCLKLEINISTLLYHFFINNDNFVNNWKQFKSAQHTGMKNYINYTMSEFYNLNSDIDLTLYIKYTNKNASINIIETPISVEQYTKYENFKSFVSFVNNEYIFTILIDMTTGYDIHPQIKIYRK